jgi:hypothetical protein
MKQAIFFLLALLVCIGMGVVQFALGLKIPIWMSFAIGTAIIAPLLTWVSHHIYTKHEESLVKQG